jgi:hypothetical protein
MPIVRKLDDVEGRRTELEAQRVNALSRIAWLTSGYTDKIINSVGLGDYKKAENLVKELNVFVNKRVALLRSINSKLERLGIPRS